MKMISDFDVQQGCFSWGGSPLKSVTDITQSTMERSCTPDEISDIYVATYPFW